MDFGDLPPEMIDKICSKMETSDLLRLSQTSSEIGNICFKEIQKRKEEKYLNVENQINKSGYLLFRKEPGSEEERRRRRMRGELISGTNIVVTVTHGLINSHITIIQYGFSEPPILDQMDTDPLGYIKKADGDINPTIKQLARNLVERGYVKSR